MEVKANHRDGDLKTHYKTRKRITEAEARYIIAHATKSSNEWVVIQYFDKWFDIRGLTEAEVADMLEDLGRERAFKLTSGSERPH